MSGPGKRAAVYDNYWESMGGGERHAGMIAQVLSEDGWQVELLGPRPLPVGEIGEHLALDLARCRFRTLPDEAASVVEPISADYDLFVNATYMSRVRPRAAHSLYLCFFPTPFDHDYEPWRRTVARAVGPYATRTQRHYQFGAGWYPPEGGTRRSWHWTTGDAALALPAGGRGVIEGQVARVGSNQPTTLQIVANGVVVSEVPVGPRFKGFSVQLGEAEEALDVHFVSDTFTPGGGDHRNLGVAVSKLKVGGRHGIGERLGMRFPWLLRDPGNLSFLEHYQAVLANSAFTRDWIERLWQREAIVLYPPIHPGTGGRAERERSIVALGRFFPPGRGHSKRQLDMVQFFGRAWREGRLDGTRFYVMGGCEPVNEHYLDEVRRAALGLPVEILPNAPRPVVEDVLGRATVFWSATGYGDDDAKTPWNMEHFGMTTVEAMRAGCVPVVIDRAGQREIVRGGVDGYRWETPAELIARTAEVLGSASRYRELSDSARQRAGDFSDAAFAARLRQIMADLKLDQA